jgi:hypothetical protein
MGLGDRLADGQTQPGAFGFINSGRRHGGKFLENRAKIFFGNANTMVHDAYGRIRLVFFNSNEDFCLPVGKLNGDIFVDG